MKDFANAYSRLFRYLLPSPFTIALLLSSLTFVLAFLLTRPSDVARLTYVGDLFDHWQNGLWNDSLMVFAMQMMLMLVLGHSIALTPMISKLIDKVLVYCNSTASAALFVTLSTLIVAYFNWGLGLIFGAIFARKVGDNCSRKSIPLNYPLIGAAGYSGLMVWHGGLSGSSLTKVAEPGHLASLMAGIDIHDNLEALPESIGIGSTVFSPMNIFVGLTLLITLPTLMYVLGSRVESSIISLPNQSPAPSDVNTTERIGLEKLDYSIGVSAAVGMIILLYAVYQAIWLNSSHDLSFINPNYINLVLLGLALLLHQNLTAFITSIDDAIVGAAGILIQFPLYFGIMGLVKGSGLIYLLSTFFLNISNEVTFPLYTFFSAGLVNIFVPSGGGQWAIQGGIIVQTALEMKLPLEKCILSFAYGDQLTNMLQPFWALPLLGITGLKAKEILPYTLLLMLVGMVIFIAAILLF